MKKAISLKRALHPMPKSVRTSLAEKGLMEAYKARPPYQRNDYIGWIVRAKQEATRAKRLSQMLTELKAGTHYMGMAWRQRKLK
jgi:uncharacterized protein YdeI (YjbR/CyaY-like superfamily)